MILRYRHYFIAIIGFLSIVGQLVHWPILSFLGRVSAASPAPFVFDSIHTGVEYWTYDIELKAVDQAQHSSSMKITHAHWTAVSHSHAAQLFYIGALAIHFGLPSMPWPILLYHPLCRAESTLMKQLPGWNGQPFDRIQITLRSMKNGTISYQEWIPCS